MAVWKLANPLQHYAWGSTAFIPALLGAESDPSLPVAEMWIGAHPQAPSRLRLDDLEIPLDGFIAGNPEATLGLGSSLYGGQLPFLLKVLAAARPLSIQVHPSREQARQGFARENSLGVPISAPERNYRDDNHKPELLCALTPFTALCGFRPYREIVANIRDYGLEPVLGSFAEFERFPDSRHLSKLFLQIMTLAEDLREEAIETLLDRVEEPDPVGAACLMLQDHFPWDPGVLAPLYLNLVTLRPGEAIYLPAGVLHAYLEGAGIELMANSDNVLRGGLTPKHIDLVELARVLDFNPYPPAQIQPVETQHGRFGYACPAEEFYLERWDVDTGQRGDTHGLPALLLCDRGTLDLQTQGGGIALNCGESAFLSADTGPYTLSGPGSCWLATLPAKTETPARS